MKSVHSDQSEDVLEHDYEPAGDFREQMFNHRLVHECGLLFGDEAARKLANELGLWNEVTAVKGAAERFQASLPPDRRQVMMLSDIVDHMAALSETLPCEGLWAGAANMFAELIERAQLRLTEDEVRILVGIGALIYRQGQRDFEPDGVLRHLVDGTKPN